jgi:phage terminase small subunit
VYAEEPEKELNCDVGRLNDCLDYVVYLEWKQVLQRIEWIVVKDQQTEQDHHPLLDMTEVIVVELVDLKKMLGPCDLLI